MGGIRFYLSDYCNFTYNLVHHNPVDGVLVDSSNGTLIQGNIIYDNYQWGAHLIYANATRTFGNDFVLNALRDAIEFNSVGPNFWDDGVSLGNYWWGISRTLDNYTIYDGSMVEMGQDNYPMSSMWIENASSFGFEITSTGNVVTWNAFGHNPDSYEVYVGATILIDTTMWTGSDITIDVDGLSVGNHNLMIRIYHYSGHFLMAFVEIQVTDTTPPVWVSTPTDQEITYGDPLSYQLQATDPSGIASWSVNDSVNFAIEDGLLTNDSVLEVGTYNVQITVEDPYGNQLTVTITITVTEPLTPPPEELMLLLAATGGGIAVLVVIIVIAKKKRGS
jgi:parallel beta-helix repeat protein